MTTPRFAIEHGRNGRLFLFVWFNSHQWSILLNDRHATANGLERW